MLSGMKALLLAVVLVTALACPVLAEDPDFAKLKQNYQAAVERAKKPLDTTYASELKKLLEKQTKAGKLDDARATMEELEALTGEKVVDTSANASFKDFEKLIVGTSWKHVAGSISSFKKDGTGTKEERGEKRTFLWRILEPGVVEVSGNLNADNSPRKFIFKIISRREGFYGDSLETATMPLTPVN